MPHTFAVCLTPSKADLVGVTPLNVSTGRYSHAGSSYQCPEILVRDDSELTLSDDLRSYPLEGSRELRSGRFDITNDGDIAAEVVGRRKDNKIAHFLSHSPMIVRSCFGYR